MSIITPTATDHGLGAGITPSGLMLDGEEQVVLCASLFYFRIPRELWASRLQQVRASGYRAIDVYVPWNFHELAPGEWDYPGRRGAAAALHLADEAGLDPQFAEKFITFVIAEVIRHHEALVSEPGTAHSSADPA